MAEEHLARLVQTALDQKRLAGYSEMLRVVAESINGDACIVWRLTPGSDLTASPPKGALFAMAQWFKDEHSWTTHNLSLDHATGMAIASGSPELVNDIHKTDGVNPQDDFFRLTGMKRFCITPVQFADSRGSVNVYRRSESDISDEEFTRVQQMAAFIPGLYRTIRDRAGFRLMRNINNWLSRAEVRKTDPKLTIQRVCRLVAGTFRCLETSVFLERPHQEPGVFRCSGTTESSFVGAKNSYQKDEQGLTPWVLERNRGVQIFDLRHFEEERDRIEADYPGLTWIDRADVIHRADQGLLPRLPTSPQVPISFMAVPIVVGAEVRGAIRCCLATKPPYYFSSRELELLRIVAARISQYWNHRIAIAQSESKSHFWQFLADGVRRMNVLVHTELSGESPDPNKIYRDALQVIDSVIPEALRSRVRLQNARTGDLQTVASTEEHDPASPRRRGSETGLAVFRAQQTRIVTPNDVANYAGEFGSSGSAVVSPIWSGRQVIGVIDILSRPGQKFGEELKSLAELWGRQLGLYAHLARSISQLRTRFREEAQAYIDLEHQLKGPLMTAIRRVQDAVSASGDGQPTDIDLLALRGQLRKAYRVSKNVVLFASLAKGETPPVQRQRLEKAATARKLIEYCVDFKLTSRRGIVGSHVHEDDFSCLAQCRVEADPDLFEQAINNVLENAFKYSYPQTSVHVRAGCKDGWFHIGVENTGIPVEVEDAHRCKERGYRSPVAESVTGEGSGIGLWIVDAIMRAHEGELEVRSTRNGVTEVRLRWRCR